MRNFRDNFWQLITTLLAIGAIFATYHVFILSKPAKELQVVIESNTKLVDIKPEANQDIKILYKERPINNLLLLQARLENSGNQPIVDSDYSKNIIFNFPSNYNVTSAKVISTTPSNLEVRSDIKSKNELEIKPLLLNPGDNIKFQLFLAYKDKKPFIFDVDTRIAGIKNVKIIDLSSNIVQSEVRMSNPIWLWIILGAFIYFLTEIGKENFCEVLMQFKKSFKKN